MGTNPSIPQINDGVGLLDGDERAAGILPRCVRRDLFSSAWARWSTSRTARRETMTVRDHRSGSPARSGLGRCRWCDLDNSAGRSATRVKKLARRRIDVESAFVGTGHEALWTGGSLLIGLSKLVAGARASLHSTADDRPPSLPPIATTWPSSLSPIFAVSSPASLRSSSRDHGLGLAADVEECKFRSDLHNLALHQISKLGVATGHCLAESSAMPQRVGKRLLTFYDCASVVTPPC